MISNDDLFYDPQMDDDDQRWVDNHRRSLCVKSSKSSSSASSSSKQKKAEVFPLPSSDAVLNCPACMTLLCRDCQRSELHLNDSLRGSCF